VHDTNIDSQGLQFDVQAASKLTAKCLGVVKGKRVQKASASKPQNFTTDTKTTCKAANYAYLGSTVHAGKGGWDKTGGAGSEDDATLLFVADQFRGEMVGNVDGSRGIACW
jgi:hypothetical protein